MKKHFLLISLIFASILSVQAQTSPATTTPTVECSGKTYFSDNQCDICYEGGEITPDTHGVKLKEVTLDWENELDGINQNFYESSQSIAEIKTNIGTAPNPWDETGLEWGTDVKWTDNDGLNVYSLDAGKTIQIKTISGEASIPLTSPKQPTDPHFVVKIPISYYELKMGTFKESEKKTKNYCVSYTSKKVAGTNTTTSNTATGNTSNTNTSSSTTSSNTSSTNTNSSTTNTTSNNTSTTNSDTADTNTTTEDTADTSTTTINDEIPSYDAKVTLNSAGTDPTASEASKIQTGPAENMLVLMAAILLSLALFPKVNTLLNK